MRAVRYYEFEVLNPHRPVDWRWRRAQHLVAGGRYASGKRDDRITCRAVRFLRGLRRAHSRRARSGLARSMPDIWAAQQLRTGPWQRRVEVEARLLARQTHEGIALAMGTTTAVVAVFHDLFFDVSGRIDTAGYIMKAAIWKGRRAGDRDHVAEAFVRAMAYAGGTAVLDALLPCFSGSGERGRQAPQSATPPSRVYENARRLLNLYAESTSDKQASTGLRESQGRKAINRRAASEEGDQKPEELAIPCAQLEGNERFGLLDLTDVATVLLAEEVVKPLCCEAG